MYTWVCLLFITPIPPRFPPRQQMAGIGTLNFFSVLSENGQPKVANYYYIIIIIVL